MAVKITKISKTKKGRYALFCESGFLFSVDDETYFLNHVCEGDELTDSELDALLQKSDLKKAKEKALNYLSLRDYSQSELYKKLLLKFDSDTAKAAVDKAMELGLINDEKFAQARAKSLIGKNKSRREVQSVLSQKGIDRETAAEILQQLEPDDLASCRAVIQKHYISKLAAGKTPAVIAALARRGFNYSTIKSALAEFSNEDIGDYE